MAVTQAPFVLKDVTLTLIKTADVGTGTEVDYRCQLSRAELVPSTSTSGGGATLDTFCASYSDSGAGTSTWTLELAGAQNFKAVEDFSIISFNEEGEEFDFVLSPMGGVPSATNPAFEGKVTMVATPIGGTAKQYAQWTASLPCTSKPVMVVA